MAVNSSRQVPLSNASSRASASAGGRSAAWLALTNSCRFCESERSLSCAACTA
eukprot:CAMPEP_0195582878 /NCGR_PEP_ID=MMETSP0814-20130614/23041_1 /TAXON_ID=97485 /ORGANISM="Prymnesium parvum, Strain Texoma1" /LENGTH=52 /DNA_ID=CAMNT_0040720559 /DNA_START=84 /DNA_END=239 /DNA_ORIENTATION=+